MNTASRTVQNFVIDGMSCGHCVARVTKTLTGIPGVEVISVIVGGAQIAVVDASAAKAAVAALSDAGYPTRTNTLATDPVTREGGCCGGASGPAKGKAERPKCC